MHEPLLSMIFSLFSDGLWGLLNDDERSLVSFELTWAASRQSRWGQADKIRLILRTMTETEESPWLQNQLFLFTQAAREEEIEYPRDQIPRQIYEGIIARFSTLLLQSPDEQDPIALYDFAVRINRYTRSCRKIFGQYDWKTQHWYGEKQRILMSLIRHFPHTVQCQTDGNSLLIIPRKFGPRIGLHIPQQYLPADLRRKHFPLSKPVS
ncbi:MAG: hypothetical protein Q8Q20_02430 [bacterium]|nr:hypothetical protein [bacterium]